MGANNFTSFKEIACVLATGNALPLAFLSYQGKNTRAFSCGLKSKE
jgi:hypothetical protein